MASRNESRIEQIAQEQLAETIHQGAYHINRATGVSPYDNRIDNLMAPRINGNLNFFNRENAGGMLQREDQIVRQADPDPRYNYTYAGNFDNPIAPVVNTIEENNFMSFSEWGRLGHYNNISDVHSCLLRFLFFDYYLMSFTKEFLKDKKDVNEMFRIFQKLNYSMDSMVKCVEYGVSNSCSLLEAKKELFPDNLSVENNCKRHVILPKDRNKS